MQRDSLSNIAIIICVWLGCRRRSIRLSLTGHPSAPIVGYSSQSEASFDSEPATACSAVTGCWRLSSSPRRAARTHRVRWASRMSVGDDSMERLNTHSLSCFGKRGRQRQTSFLVQPDIRASFDFRSLRGIFSALCSLPILVADSSRRAYPFPKFIPIPMFF